MTKNKIIKKIRSIMFTIASKRYSAAYKRLQKHKNRVNNRLHDFSKIARWNLGL